MRLLLAMAGARHGGAETFFSRLAIGLQRAGVRQRVLTRAYPDRLETLARAGVEVVPLAFGGPLDLATRRRFRAEIAAFRPEVVATWMNRATRMCPRRQPGQRYVHVGSPRGYYDPKYYRRCDHLLCPTSDMAAFFAERGFPAGRIGIVPNFAPDERMAALPRTAFTTPDDVPLLLALGRLHANKGFDVLLHALARLPGHWLWLGGEGPLEAELRALADRLGVAERVRFLGWRADTPALYAAADLFVCSSRHEPFGNIVIEAWAQERPVVAAASQGPRALIELGVSGLLVPVEDADGLAQAVRRVSEDGALAARLIAGGRTAYEAGHSEAVGVARYLAFLDRVAA